MTDLAVSARFLRAMQPLQYEKAEAEITVSGVATSPAEVAAFMDQAQRVALAAVGKSHEFRPAGGRPAATTVEPAKTTPDVANIGGTETPKAEAGKLGEGTTAIAPRRGRPPKSDKPAEVPTQDALEAALSDAAGKPEPSADKIVGTDVEPKVTDKDLPPVTDEELQTACATAAEKITAEKVRILYKNYGNVSRVAEIEQDFRRPFLKDLADLVVKHAKS